MYLLYSYLTFSSVCFAIFFTLLLFALTYDNTNTKCDLIVLVREMSKNRGIVFIVFSDVFFLRFHIGNEAKNHFRLGMYHLFKKNFVFFIILNF